MRHFKQDDIRISSPPRLSLRVALAALLLAALLVSPAASAASPIRAFDTQLTGDTPPGTPVAGPFKGPYAVAIDGSEHIWVSDPANHAVVSEYDPQGKYLSEQTGGNHWNPNSTTILRSIAFDDSTGYFYAAVDSTNASGDARFASFDGSGAFAANLSIVNNGGAPTAVAVDNSGLPGRQGRVYLAGGDGFHGFSITAFDHSTAPHSFEFSPPGNPGEYDYIKANKITGTPAGAFNTTRGLATDPNGNIYVTDTSGVIDEFAPSGEFLRQVTGAEVPGGFDVEHLNAVAVDPTSGNVLVVDRDNAPPHNPLIDEFGPSGEFLGQLAGPSPSVAFANLTGIAFDTAGDLYVVDGGEEGGNNLVDEFFPLGHFVPEASTGAATEVLRTSATLHAEAELGGGGEITECHFEYIPDVAYHAWEVENSYTGPAAATSPCLDPAGHEVGTAAEPILVPTVLHAPLGPIPAGTHYHWRISLSNAENPTMRRRAAGPDFTTAPAVDEVQTGAPTEITNHSALLHGSYDGDGNDTHYFFEYGTSTNYAHRWPIPPVDQGTAAGTQTPSAPIGTENEPLLPNTTYHYRFLAENTYGRTGGEDHTFTTYRAPTIEGLSSSDLTATSAVLHAQINPQGLPAGVEAQCFFEYGPTTAYGTTAPCPQKLSGATGQSVSVQVENLQPAVTYHFRLTAESQWGTVTSEDQSFEFFPPSCPNSAVRQQTGAAYLPDCRAYELVSPANANGTLLYSGGPNPGTATSPSRFAFVGAYSSIPGAEDTVGTSGDLYVATRTDSGWVSHYVGIPGDQSGCVSGPPNSPFSHSTFSDEIANFIFADPDMSRFLDWADGPATMCLLSENGSGDAAYQIAESSNAPYMWGADGSFIARLPAGLSPAALAALRCPLVESLAKPNANGNLPDCTGDVAASADLTHLFFSSNSFSFAEPPQAPGLTQAPGSAYDYDLATGRTTLISRLPGGADIPQDHDFAAAPRKSHPFAQGGAEEFLRFPAVSADGSHVLISTATDYTTPCPEQTPCPRFTDTPIHLYMSIDDQPAIAIAPGHAVTYIGATPGLTRVYFTSTDQLLPADADHSADLYMWSQSGEEAGHPLTLLSAANNEGNPGEPGNSDECNLSWTVKCGVLPYSGWAYANVTGNIGGNGIADSPIAANGDVYFYSPEQLDGDHGVLGLQNLYDYREGRARYVTTLAPERPCIEKLDEGGCGLGADGPILRLEVTPDDTRMAFVTAARLTSYDNAGHLEMYSYAPATGDIVCDSCRPDGQPPTGDVFASQDGRFLTDDGRVFFSTAEPLVPRDTNEATDVYEFADGRPQLITPGTGTGTAGTGGFGGEGESLIQKHEKPGLVGVSDNGTDVYFSTFDTLVPAEDQNGNFLKFYDARTNGGFPHATPPQPCAAAEECHGPGTEAPLLPPGGSSAELTGGNATPASRHGKKHPKRAKHKRHGHRAAHRNRRASK